MTNEIHKNGRSLLKVLVLTLGTFSGTWLNASVGYSYDEYPYSENNYNRTWDGLTQDQRDENFVYVPRNCRAPLFYTLSLSGMIHNLFRVPVDQLANVLRGLTSEQRDGLWAGLRQDDRDRYFQYFPSWEWARRYQDLSEQARNDNYFRLSEHERGWAWPILEDQDRKNRNWFHTPKQDWVPYWYGLDEAGKGENFRYLSRFFIDEGNESEITSHYFELSDEWKVKNFRFVPESEQEFVLENVSPVVRAGIRASIQQQNEEEEGFVSNSPSENGRSAGEVEVAKDPSFKDGELIESGDYVKSFTGTWWDKDNPSYTLEYHKDPVLRNLDSGKKSLFEKDNEATTGSDSTRFM